MSLHLTCLVAVLTACIGVVGCNQNTNLVDRRVGPGSDAGPPAVCIPGNTQCSNCDDDDGDGLVDGFDPHCLSALDNREDSFDTGIPGDNNNTNFQDCFFDGNSGHGDDGCEMPVCCLTDPNAPNCPPASAPPFVTCTPTEVCVEKCAPLTPPGCDCFGCCTVCAGGVCHDVLTHPKLAPECDIPVLGDSSKCPVCQKVAGCGAACDPASCILCPGQRPEDLPATCTETTCPADRRPCRESSDCAANQFCAVGCCTAIVE